MTSSFKGSMKDSKSQECEILLFARDLFFTISNHISQDVQWQGTGAYVVCGTVSLICGERSSTMFLERSEGGCVTGKEEWKASC